MPLPAKNLSKLAHSVLPGGSWARHHRPVLYVLGATVLICLVAATYYAFFKVKPQRYVSPTGASANDDWLWLLRDDFERPDSASLGAPWIESGEVTSEYIAGSSFLVGSGDVQLGGGALIFRYINHPLKPQHPHTAGNGRPTVYAVLAQDLSSYPATFSFSFTPHPDGRMHHEAGFMSWAAGLDKVTNSPGLSHVRPKCALGIEIVRSSTNYNNSQVTILKYDGGRRIELAKKLLPFQFSSGEEYQIQFTIRPDFSLTAMVSDKTYMPDVAAGAAPVQCPLDTFFISDTEGGISSDTSGQGEYVLRFDNILVTQPRHN